MRVLEILAAKSIESQVGGEAGNKTLSGNGSPLMNIIQTSFYVAAIAAVIMIIIGGVNYIMSRGDPAKVAKAKNTILFSVIGLIIAVLAIAIVNYILLMMEGKNAQAQE